MTWREAVIAEAQAWIGTPYHHMARAKGSGVDCAMLLAEVYERAGVIKHVTVDYYPCDWAVHQNVQRFLAHLTAHCAEIEKPQPGDIALFQFGQVYSHGAIVLEWPLLVHANRGAGIVELIDAERDPHLARCTRKFLSPFPAHNNPIVIG